MPQHLVRVRVPHLDGADDSRAAAGRVLATPCATAPLSNRLTLHAVLEADRERQVVAQWHAVAGDEHVTFEMP